MLGIKSIFKVASVALVATFGLTGASSAATMTFMNSDPTPKLNLLVDDGAVAGAFRFSLSTTVGTADYLGLGFNLSGLGIMQSDISLVSATLADNTASTPNLVLYGNQTGSQNTCGMGCNFNGSGSATVFDYIIRIGEQGGGSNFVKTVVFDIAYVGSLAASPFSDFVARAQSTTNPGGSIKADLDCVPGSFGCGPGVNVVPLPAGLPLLLSAFGMGAFVTRRARKKA